MTPRTPLRVAVAFGIAASFAGVLYSAEPAAQAPSGRDRTGPSVAAQNLDNPSGVAFHPESGDMYVAERRGIFRVYQDENNQRKKTPVVNKFPVDTYGKGPIYDIGPLGIAFLGKDQLVIGDGSRPDTEELILVVPMGATPPSAPIAADDATYKLGPLGSSDELKAEGNYYAVVVTADAIFATANGDDTKGWIVRAAIENGKPGPLERFIATKEAVNVDAPVAMAVNADGDLVVGQMGEINVPGDSLLTVYDAKTGKLKHNWPTGLNDITGLAYSPATGKLYATDFAWADASQGGLFELTVADDKVQARKVAELDKPTAIAFNAQGAAFVTVFGTAEAGAEGKPGKVLRFRKREL